MLSGITAAFSDEDSSLISANMVTRKPRLFFSAWISSSTVSYSYWKILLNVIVLAPAYDSMDVPTLDFFADDV